MKTLSVFSMCLNEIHFIELYLRSNLRFADQIVIIDGGSTDGTIDVLADYAARYLGRLIYEVRPQTGQPYSKDWDTGVRRQWCLDHCTSNYVMRLDIDELPDDRFVTELPGILDAISGDTVANLNWLCFWSDWRTVRDNAPGSLDGAKWRGIQPRVWWNDGRITYPDNWHHSGECGLDRYNRYMRPNIDILHLHYADKRYLKAFDNRRGEIGCADNNFDNPQWEGIPDLPFPINLRPFNGEYPAILKEMGFIQ